ncbi:hypothetical protein [Vibrio coralliilyticus]|uniref:hypothetical protein n=1 Tax=Vibrio coralliilyticus TaxID=190893 RepID=UPI000BAB22CA|nr:hypothetical protein [Vibrio coralliilyticus]NOI59250.1 hypothetical protein [Vibrio coralliilyticus]PAT69895.1 hypothetical protein CKA27_03800 [Vibrio coralliilyticus]
MRRHSNPVLPTTTQKTTRELAASQQSQRITDSKYTPADYDRWQKRCDEQSEAAAKTKRLVSFLHIGTRSVHRNTVNIVAEFDKDGNLKPNSEEALKGLVDGNKDYVIGFSGHSIPIKNGTPNKYTYTKEVNGKMAGKVDTAGAMRSISDCLKVKGSSIVGLVDGHCFSKTRSLSTMLKGLDHELDESRIHSTTKKTTAEESRMEGLKMVMKLNKR